MRTLRTDQRDLQLQNGYLFQQLRSHTARPTHLFHQRMPHLLRNTLNNHQQLLHQSTYTSLSMNDQLEQTGSPHKISPQNQNKQHGSDLGPRVLQPRPVPQPMLQMQRGFTFHCFSQVLLWIVYLQIFMLVVWSP